MKVFYSTDHDSHYPVGAASVIVAKSKKHARVLLDVALIADSLKSSVEHPYELTELETSNPEAVILVNGNY